MQPRLLPRGTRPRFAFGHIALSSEALRRLSIEDVSLALGRHVQGDWGEVSAEDTDANERALADSSRLLSVYRDRCGVVFWIITEANRSATTVLLPADY